MLLSWGWVSKEQNMYYISSEMCRDAHFNTLCALVYQGIK